MFRMLTKSPRFCTQKLFMADGGPSFSSSPKSASITVSPSNAVSWSAASTSRVFLDKPLTAAVKLSSITQARTAVEAVNAVKTMAEQRNIILTQSEIESIPQLMMYYLTQAESNAKETFRSNGNNVKYKPYLSSYLLADCAWGTGTLQSKRTNERIQQDGRNVLNKRVASANSQGKKNLQRDYSTSSYENKNDFYLSELAIKIITNLRMQNDHVKGRDFAKIMIGFERMGVQWDNIQPDELAIVLTDNVSNLDARGLSNVLWSLGHLYVQFDDLSVLLKVSATSYLRSSWSLVTALRHKREYTHFHMHIQKQHRNKHIYNYYGISTQLYTVIFTFILLPPKCTVICTFIYYESL